MDQAVSVQPPATTAPQVAQPMRGVKPSHNMSSTYSLRPARVADLPAVAKAWAAAFFDDDIIGALMHPHRSEYPEDVYCFLLRGVRERFWDWRHRLVVATDATGTVVGAADWRRLGPGGADRELAWADPRNLIAPVLRSYHKALLTVFPNRAADPTQSGWLVDAVAASERHWTGPRAECWDLHVCGVHPDFQAKGVGRLLARWGVDQAAQEGENVVASVLCGEKNRGFYSKAGFHVEVAKGEGGLALFTR